MIKHDFVYRAESSGVKLMGIFAVLGFEIIVKSFCLVEASYIFHPRIGMI